MKKRIATLIAVMALVAVLAACLVACMPSDPAKAEENLKAEGYDVTLIEEDLGDGMVALLRAEKEDDSITIYYFDDKDAANKYWEDEEMDDYEAQKEEGLKELEQMYKEDLLDKDEYEEMKKSIEDAKVKKQGKIIYAGTSAAIKAAK